MKKCTFILLSGLLLFRCTLNENLDDQGNKPNIILIMTDDQGYGDIGYTGNPLIHTPTLDSLSSHSSRFSHFYVSPVCAPTRSSLMTGRFSIRTGVYDTYNGGAVMASEETTIAEILKENGYQTGIFGKWHLGDNYPFRPGDQGFKRSLVHLAGGIGQPGDFYNYHRNDSSYFDPILLSNGTPVNKKGYCSDIFTNEAISFIRQSSGVPFYTYLSFNAPHTPLQLPKQYYDMYKNLSFSGHKDPLSKISESDKEDARKVYGMVTNIDDNIKKLISVLRQSELLDNTILIFLTDNGPQQDRFTAGLRDRKGSVYEGGIRVPCFVYLPDKYASIREVNSVAAHIDLFPTILDYAGVDLPDNLELDGESLRKAIAGKGENEQDRKLYFHWNRGFPSKYQNMAVRSSPFKLVAQNVNYQAPLDSFELYNLDKDPFEEFNIVDQDREIATSLKSSLDSWLDQTLRNAHTQRVLPVLVGTGEENPVMLNRNDAKGPPKIWKADDLYAYWDIEIVETAEYDITFHLQEPLLNDARFHAEMAPYHFSIPVAANGQKEIRMKGLKIEKGSYRFEPYLFKQGRIAVGESRFVLPLYIEIDKK